MRLKLKIVFPFVLLIACAHLKEAKQSYHQQDYTKAILLCKSAIVKDSTDIQAWLLLSQIYLEMDSSEKSLNALSHLQTLTNRSDKENAQIADQYQIHAKKTTNINQSIAYLLLAEKIDSMNVSILDTLASLLYSQDMFDEAKSRYNRLIELSDDSAPYMNRVNSIENRQVFALDEYDKGMDALKTGKNKEAEDHLNQAATTDPSFSEAVYEYGMLAGRRLYKEGNQEALDKAIPALRKAVIAKPTDVEVRFLLAKACERKGQSYLGEAIQNYKDVIRLSPKGQYVKTCKQKIKTLTIRKNFWEKGKN